MLAALAAAGTAGAYWTDFGGDCGAAEVRLLESTPGGMTVELVLPGVELAPVAEPGLDFVSVSVPGTAVSAEEPGMPALPRFSFLAAVPASPSVTWTVTEARTVQLGLVTPYPMQPVMPDTSRSSGEFAFDAASYSGGLHPSSQVCFASDGLLRGVPVGRFVIFPFSWDASTGELTAFSRMVVEIDFGGAVAAVEDMSPWFEGTYGRTLLNSGLLGGSWPSRFLRSDGVEHLASPGDAGREGADLLIIAGDEYADTMLDEFATAKYEQGYLTTVVAGGSWTSAQIKEYIQNAYDNWDPAPSFVLLVGDHPQLPAYSYNGMLSDNRYCCVSGPDYMSDIFRGRFPCSTDWMQTVSDKIMKWEFDPLTDPAFWNSVLCAGYFQDDNNNGIADRWFLFTCETVRDTYLLLFGKTVEREYTTNSTHALPWYYRPDPPSAGQQVPLDITWDGSAAGINAAVNNGVFLVQHRDHGMVDGWADPMYVTSDLAGLANGDETPVVFSVNCLTGQFSDDCFSEALFRMQGGAVAVFAAVEVSYSYFNDYLCYGFYHSFNDQYVSPPAVYTTPGGGYLAGQTLMGGQLEMQAAAPFNPYGSWESYAEDEWDLFHVFGDPTMDMRTEVPGILTVEAPAELPAGSASAAFLVTSSGLPVDNAQICLRKPDESVYVTAFTDSTGAALLEFPAISLQTEMPWMVSSHNTIPLEGSINGQTSGGSPQGPASSSCGLPFPNPASTMVGFPVAMAQAGTASVTVFDLAGRIVWSTSSQLQAGSHLIAWEPGVPSGVYLTLVEVPGAALSSRVLVAR
jgi:hypothetical protein